MVYMSTNAQAKYHYMILSIAPRIVFAENAIDNQQCNDIINSSIEFVNSGVYDQSGNALENSYYRNSMTYKDTSGIFTNLQELAVLLSKQYAPHADFNVVPEPVQIQKYALGQEYKSHCDFSTLPSFSKVFEKPRVATVIFYLNDDFIGGHTYFDRLQLEVKPVTGAALVFYYPSDNFELGMLTEHCGKPVTNGTKYIATVWLQSNT